MGLIQAAVGSVGGVLADQWKEFFYCESLGANVLVAKGEKRTGGRTSNKKGEDNIISNGSVIAVNEGQCMIIVEQGKVMELSAVAGEYTYDKSSEPSIFYGSLGQSIKDTIATIGRRIGFGGDTGKDQRVYYFNIKEIVGNKYGTASPVPFRVVDKNVGLDIDIGIRCHGEYSYKVADPVKFYVNVCGNVESDYSRAEIDSQLQSELMTALQPAFAKISDMGIRYSSLPGHTDEIANALNEVLSGKWGELRGIKVASFGVSSVTASPEDEDRIKNLQQAAALKDPTMAAAALASAQAEAMKAAAANTGAGSVMAFAGLNMAQQAGGANVGNLYSMGAQQQADAAANAAAWTCACGAKNTGKFCADCGKPMPVANGWTCACGAVNKGKFCADCGKPKPAGAKQYKCDKCGWEVPAGENPPKFCPQCGDPMDDNDIVK